LKTLIFSEHFDENHMILLQMVARWRCIKVCAIFSGPLCRGHKEYGYFVLFCRYKCQLYHQESSNKTTDVYVYLYL